MRSGTAINAAAATAAALFLRTVWLMLVSLQVHARLIASVASPVDIHEIFLILSPGLKAISLALVSFLENWYLVRNPTRVE